MNPSTIADWNRSLDGVERGIASLREQLGALLAAPVALSSGGRSGDAWEKIVFGDEIVADAASASARRALLEEVIAGSPPATALAGQLLLIRAASVEELPELFHRVGEAYYRWRPRVDETDEPLERALADCLSRRAEACGLRNSIELVRVGDRYDANRHLADGPGIEVAAVHGWIVTRDNQKAYTSACVSLK